MRSSLLLTTLGLAGLALQPAVSISHAGTRSIELTAVGSVAAGQFLRSAAEIAAYDPATKRVFVVNAQEAQIDVVDLLQPANPVIVGSIVVQEWGAVANSVAVRDGLLAVAVEANPKTDPGAVVFFDRDLQPLSAVQVGALPDMLTFSPNGRYVLVANEGEPSDDYEIDPEGSVSIIDLSNGAAALTQQDVRTAGFTAFTRPMLPDSVRIFGPDATVAQDMEPEFIAVSSDSKTAWVTLQENNAIAVVDIGTAAVTRILGLGTKDHSLAANGFGSGNAIDASDRDGVPVANAGRINITTWPVKGFYLPDGIASYSVGNQTYLLHANEGDTRAWTGYNEETRVADLALDPVSYPNGATLKAQGNLGRLRVTRAQGDFDGDGDYDQLYSFGARSFSIRTVDGALVWDSGDQFERITAAAVPKFFNVSNDANTFDARSSTKGPEPEGVVIGKVSGRTYAFVGLERIGGIMIFDVTNPLAPTFIQYANNRDFTKPVQSPEAGDLGPEGLLFISEEESPNEKPLLVVSNEVSGTTTIYEINRSAD